MAMLKKQSHFKVVQSICESRKSKLSQIVESTLEKEIERLANAYTYNNNHNNNKYLNCNAIIFSH